MIGFDWPWNTLKSNSRNQGWRLQNRPKTRHSPVSKLNPVTRHNFKVTKTFTSAAYSYLLFDNESFSKKYLEGSATYLPFLPSPPDCLALSPYCLSAINDYRIEYDAETCRHKHFPLYSSRLSAIFAFGDYETCKKVSELYRWDLSSVKKFKLHADKFARVIKVNMEIVSLARTAYRISTFEEPEEILWRAYWQGNGNVAMELPDAETSRKRYDSDLIWEYLIEGQLLAAE